MDNGLYRTNDVKFNIESGFYAALNMLHKEIPMQYIPLTRLTIGDKELYYYGERNGIYDQIIYEGDVVKDDKFIVYYARNGIVCGFATFGYQNLHLYLMEAMKQMVMPISTEIELTKDAYKRIVNLVVSMSDDIECNRHKMIAHRAEVMATKDHDVTQFRKLKEKIKENVKKKKEELVLEEKRKAEELKQKKMKEQAEDMKAYNEKKKAELFRSSR
jgi:hypothetical protein